MATRADFANFCYLFICMSIVAHVVYALIRKYASSSINTCLRIPSPPSLPIIGHLHLLSSSLPKRLESLASRYGPIMLIRFGATPIVVVSDATIAKEILRTHDVDFASKYALGFRLSQLSIYQGASFFNSEYGSYWRFMKKLCVTQLFAGTLLEQFIHIRDDEMQNLLKSLVTTSGKGEVCDIREELTNLTYNIICRMAMTKRCMKKPDLPREIRKLAMAILDHAMGLSFSEVFGPLQKFNVFGNGKRLVSAMWEYDRRMEQLIKEYEDEEMLSCEKEAGKDMMDILLKSFRESNSELKLTRDHIKIFFLDLVFAGTDSTIATIQRAITELIKNPNILKKLRKEIDSVVGFSRLIKESDIPNLPYLQAIVKETLRLHPIAPFLRRQCNVDTKLNGYELKAGTKLLINAFSIMHNPNTWNQPDKFIPERFIDDNHEMDFKGQDLHFIPFGSGRRICIGASHALTVSFATIASVMQCFDLKFKDDADTVEIKLATGYSGVTPPPLMCYPVIRFNPFKA